MSKKNPKFQPRVPRKPSHEKISVLPEPYARLLKIAERLKLKNDENAGNELRNEDIKKDQQRSGETQEPVLWKRLVQSVTTMDVLSPIRSGIQTNTIINDESKRSFNKNDVFDDVIELTTIVRKIRRRNERDTQSMNRSLNSTKKNITNTRRFKRSIMNGHPKKRDDSPDVTKESTACVDKLYRHPKLTYEDKKTEKVSKEFSDIAKENNTNANEFADFYKRIWDIINGTRPRFKIVVPSIKEPRRTQVEIFKDVHTASASEVEDLNLFYNKTEDKKLLGEVPFDDKRPSQEDELEKYVKAEVEGVEDRSTLIPFEKLENNDDENYNYPSSGSINEDKETDDQTADSPEEIDSSVENLNLPFNQTGFLNGDTKLSAIREPVNSVPDDVKEHSTLLFKNKKPIEEDQEIYDPDKIPYVEVPDYEDEREKSLDEQDRRQAEEENMEPLNIVNSSGCAGSEKPVNSTNSKKGTMDDLDNPNLEPYQVAMNEHSGQKLESPGNVQDDLNNTKKDENARDEIQSKEEEEFNEESVLSIIPFDINEYKKPFNLHDFLKNEPFFAKLRKDNDYVRESSDRDEVTEDGNYSTAFEDNTSLDFADADEQDPRYEHVLENRSNRDIDDTRNATGSEEAISEDLYRYGDKDFFKRLFEENRKKRENFEISAEEQDFLGRYFTKDVIEKLREDSAEEELRETRKNEMMEKYKNKKDALKALSSILAKKDRISRLDEEVNKEIQDGKNIPSAYKNYWSLEYVLPGGNDQSSNENKTASS